MWEERPRADRACPLKLVSCHQVPWLLLVVVLLTTLYGSQPVRVSLGFNPNTKTG